MAAIIDRFRELAWYIQAGIYFAVAVGVFLMGEFLPYSPVRQKVEEKMAKEAEEARLVTEVAVLKETQRRHDEFQAKVKAAEQQLLATKAVIPDEKRTDDFMRSIQESVVNAQIGIRRLTAKPVVYEQYYAKLPMEIQVDGAYYKMLDFYQRLSRLTRVVNVGELRLEGVEGKQKPEYGADTSVSGTCLLTTYYTASEAELAAAAPATRGAPARGPGAPGAPGPPR